MPPAAPVPRAVALSVPSRSLSAAETGLLALVLLPLCVLLWSISRGGPSAGGDTLPVVGTLVAAAIFAAITTILALLAADNATHPGSPASRWWWPGLVGLLLLPTLEVATHLLTALITGHLHARPWLLVFLGILDAQMIATANFRQAVSAIPASRSRLAALECITVSQRIRHVILPACLPALATLATVTFAGTWSEFLLSNSLYRAPDLFTLGGGLGPANFVTATYLSASLLTIFLGLWTLRACLRALASRPFARA